ncbi:MAG: MGH1-like glycoside hydrolase domain-containing protein [Planctomycetota bacterium]|jgi:hypothetical protein
MSRQKIANHGDTSKRMCVCLVVLLIVGDACAAKSDGKQWQRKQMADKIQREAQPYVDKGMYGLDLYLHTEDPKINALMKEIFKHCLLNKVAQPMPPALPHRWLTASGMYVGQWLWDTQFMLIAMCPLGDDPLIRDVYENWWYTIDNNPEAPKGSYRYGFVPNFLKKWPPEGFTQIAILGWGCRMVERQTNDKQLIERALPYLIAFDKWHTTERDVDQDGLIEFGAYKNAEEILVVSMQQTARYEAFDHHPTTKTMKMTKHPKYPDRGQWYGNREGVEVTCFVLMSERAIIEIARDLGKQKIVKQYEKIYQRRCKAVRDKMWDPQKKFFYTLDRDSDRKVPIRTIQGFFTMTCGAATKKQAAILVKQLRDPKQWRSPCPVPTVAMDDKTYKTDGYWGGDMWPATTYLVTLGLNRYGYHEDAYKLTKKMIDLFITKGIYEHYDSMSGKPLGIKYIPMCCSIWSMIVQNLYGIQEDFRTIVIPPQAKGRSLTCGKLQVSYPENHVVELRTKFKRNFHVVYPRIRGNLKAVVSCDDPKMPPVRVKLEGNKVTFTAQPDKTYRVTPLR